jgi:hypothetical protein
MWESVETYELLVLEDFLKRINLYSLMKLIYVFMVTTNNRVFTLSPVYILLDQKGIGSDVIQLVERLMVYIILYVAVLPNSNILLGQECLPCIKKCSLAYNNTSLETTVHCSQYHKQSEYNYV